MSSDWKPKQLGEVVEVKSGQVDPTAAPYATMPHVGGDNIESHSGQFSGISTAKELGLKSGKYLFDSEDILYSKIPTETEQGRRPRLRGDLQRRHLPDPSEERWNHARVPRTHAAIEAISCLL